MKRIKARNNTVFSKATKCWTEPTPSRKFTIALLLVSVILYAIATLFCVLKATPYLWLFGKGSVVNPPKFALFLYGASSFVLAAYFVIGFFANMRPVDVLFSIVLVCAANIFANVLSAFISDIVTIIFVCAIVFFGTFGAVGIILYELFPAVFEYFVPVTMIAMALFIVIGAIVIGISAIIAIPVAILLALVCFFTSSDGFEKRKWYEWLISLVLIVFLAWPMLSATGNFNGVLQNKMGRYVGLMVTNPKNKEEQSLSDPAYFEINSYYYDNYINSDLNSNLSAGVGTHGQYFGDNDFSLASVTKGTATISDERWLYYKNKLKVDVPDDALIVSYWNELYVILDDGVYCQKFDYDHYKAHYGFTELDWKSEIENKSEEEFEQVILTNLIRQNHGGTNIDFLKGFAQTAYAQKAGRLLDFDDESETAYFTVKDGNHLQFVSLTADGSRHIISDVDADFRGIGVGYYMVRGAIYYANRNELVRISISDGSTNVEYDNDGVDIYNINYYIDKNDLLTHALMGDDMWIRFIIDGNRINLVDSLGYFTKENFRGMQVVGEIEKTYGVVEKPKATPLVFLKNYFKNKEVELPGVKYHKIN